MTAQTILPANTLSSGYDVANSLMFNDGDSAYLDKTPSGDGSRVKWTWSGWVKRCSFGHQPIFSTPGNSSNIYDEGEFKRTEKIQYSAVVSGTQYALRTTRTFKDVGAWYHIVLIFDSNNATAGDRMQLWINGVRTAEADMEDTTFKDAQNYNSATNKASYVTYLGRVSTNTAAYFDGYMAEVVFQNDNADSPVDKFGEFDEDSGIWKPINVSGLSLGTNGSYLDFEDSSDLGNDKSGSNNWSSNNLAATDQSTDTCTNNFATLNILVKGNTSPTFSQGNIQIDAGGNWGHAVGTIGLASGKWYWEVDNITASSNVFLGICNESNVSHLDNDSTPYSEAGLILYFQDGRRTIDGTSSEGEYNAFGTTHGFALDLDSGTRTIKFYRDNSLEATENLTANFAAGDFVFPIFMGSASSNACGVDFQFGGTVASALASAESDANGYGAFEFAPPSGYYAICTKNLAEYG